MSTRTLAVSVLALWAAHSTAAAYNARAQTQFAPRVHVRAETPDTLEVPNPLASNRRLIAVPALVQPAPASPSRQPVGRTCSRGRRTWIGALIGAAAAAPVAKVAHDRFENEAANGTAAAASMIALGVAGGAFIGLSTCQ
jgi:hypothetical protein